MKAASKPHQLDVHQR